MNFDASPITGLPVKLLINAGLRLEKPSADLLINKILDLTSSPSDQEAKRRRLLERSLGQAETAGLAGKEALASIRQTFLHDFFDYFRA